MRARAGTIQAPGLARPGGAVETDRLPSGVRDRAMEAVDHFGGRVTIGDVASRAGLQLAQAERALQALAADTGGFLEVRLLSSAKYSVVTASLVLLTSVPFVAV